MTAVYDIVQLSTFKRRNFLANYSTASLAIWKKVYRFVIQFYVFIYSNWKEENKHMGFREKLRQRGESRGKTWLHSLINHVEINSGT